MQEKLEKIWIHILNFQEATCNGKEATCPASLPMADSTKCIDRGECRGGKCIPFCETQDLQVRTA